MENKAYNNLINYIDGLTLTKLRGLVRDRDAVFTNWLGYVESNNRPQVCCYTGNTLVRDFVPVCPFPNGQAISNYDVTVDVEDEDFLECVRENALEGVRNHFGDWND